MNVNFTIPTGAQQQMSLIRRDAGHVSTGGKFAIGEPPFSLVRPLNDRFPQLLPEAYIKKVQVFCQPQMFEKVVIWEIFHFCRIMGCRSRRGGNGSCDPEGKP